MANGSNPNFILPVGTKVVTRVWVRRPDGTEAHPRGAVGIVISSPADHQHAYRIRFLDAFEASLKRSELSTLKDFQMEGMASPSDALIEYDLTQHVIYRCVVGSRAYGLDDAGSDYDHRGVYLPPADIHWSLFGIPEQLENTDTEECYWELQKFLVMALKANPNILECLYTPLVEHATPLARKMLENRHRFLSTRVYQTYNGYVASQFKKLESDLRNKGQVKWKHIMHLLRLLHAGIGVLKEGHVQVRVEGDLRDQLLSIKRGERQWEDLDQWRKRLHIDFDAVLAATKLPEHPDYEWANEFLIEARRSMI